MSQVKLFHAAGFTTDKNDIHTDYSSNVDTDAETIAFVVRDIESAPSSTGRLCRYLTQNKDFRTVSIVRSAMQIMLNAKL